MERENEYFGNDFYPNSLKFLNENDGVKESKNWQQERE